jgi:hypothetical protein
VPIQDISDTVGRKSTHVTEMVYRHVIVPAICGGASVMDRVFGDQEAGEPGSDIVVNEPPKRVSASSRDARSCEMRMSGRRIIMR